MIRVRACRQEDNEVVLALAREFATSFPVSPEGFSAVFLEVLSSPHMYLGVAESPDGVIGYVLGTAHPAFYASGQVAWVEEIMVKTEFRKKGIGKLLMESFENWATDKNCRLIALATRRAAEFYKSLNYTESATYFRKVIS